MTKLDAVVVGAGVIGLAVARRLAMAGREVVVLEGEAGAGRGASSRNSQVIHAGIYYPPGSAKARHCVAGKRLLYRYCAAHAIGHRRIGKLIVAGEPAGVPRLRALERNAGACGVTDLKRLDAAEIAALEPAVRGVEALLSPSTGIIDCRAFVLQLIADLEARRGSLLVRHPVAALLRGPRLGVRLLDGSEFACRILVNAAGLQAVKLAASRESGRAAQRLPRQYYAKGHYFVLSGPAPFRRLIYPLPEDGGLGIHATVDLEGRVRFGPDVHWLTAEDYGFTADPQVFTEAIARYYPQIAERRLTADFAGVRSKLSGPGEAAADFFVQGPPQHKVDGLFHLFGFESPGLTAALSVAEEVAAAAGG